MSFKNLKEQEKEQRREYIIDAAEKLFLDKGYDNVPMSDIADEIGVNRATLYLYFKNKNSLYFSVLLRGLYLMKNAFQKSIKKDQNGLKRLTSLCRTFFRYCHEYPEYYRELSYMRSHNFDIEQIENVNDHMIIAQELMDFICNSIEMGIEDGSMKEELEPMKTAVFVVNNCEKLVNPGQDMVGFMDIQNITPDEYMEYSFNLLKSTISNQKEFKSD